MSTLAAAATVTTRIPRLRVRRQRVVRTEARAYVAERDYIPSSTADMWRCAKPQYRR
jgi:hypothetical protein